METLGWIILIILAFIFGPQLLATINPPVPFSQPNAVPTPNGLPASSVQNQMILNTANAPAPWANVCTAPTVAVTPPSPSLPLMPTNISSSPVALSNVRPHISTYNAG